MLRPDERLVALRRALWGLLAADPETRLTHEEQMEALADALWNVMAPKMVPQDAKHHGSCAITEVGYCTCLDILDALTEEAQLAGMYDVPHRPGCMCRFCGPQPVQETAPNLADAIVPEMGTVVPGSGAAPCGDDCGNAGGNPWDGSRCPEC
jgi:hypothetical protein